MFTGTYTALVTPFSPDGELDLATFRTLIERQVEGGVDGIVPMGTTGESPTVNFDDHQRVIAAAVEAVAGRCKVIAGTGGNATAEAELLTRHAKDAGADGTLQVTPYYNKPNQEGLYRHFSRIADIGLPVVLYNIPGRTSREIELATMVRLAAHPQVVAVKEAAGSADAACLIVRETGLTVLSGDDPLTLPMMIVGGSGVVSVASNLVPAEVTALTHAALAGDWEKAREWHQSLYPLFQAVLKLDTNPIPVKTALALMGLLEDRFRLPMCPMDDAGRETLRRILQEAGLLLSEPVRVVIVGAAGRMGQMLVRGAMQLEGVTLAGAVEREGDERLGQDAGVLAGVGACGVVLTDSLADACASASVAIDFSFHSAVPGNAETASGAGCPLVIGTTGLDPEATARVRACAAAVPVVWAPNMSVGVNLLFALTRRAASLLGPEYDIEIVETHHRHKQDAPSGTALRLAEKAADGRAVELERVANYGRKGLTGERPRGEIGIHSVRSGDVVGDHVVSFAAEGERVELVHKASSRNTFALGALHAAQWVVRREPGLYDMQDVLGAGLMEFGLSLGSNLGDRALNLARATRTIGELPGVRVVAESPVYETSPVDVPAAYADLAFLNSVVVVESDAAPTALHEELAAIEHDMHRTRGEKNAPRVIDIDMIYAGDVVLDGPGLVLPHPRTTERRFVLQPLADVRPALRLPGRSDRVADLLSALPAGESVVRFAA